MMKKIQNAFLLMVLLSTILACNTEQKEVKDVSEDLPEVSNSIDGTPETSQNITKRYYIKSGHIKYKMEGTAVGSSDLYFDNWGMTEADYETSTMEIMGQKSETNKLLLMLGSDVYSIDFTKNVGSKSANPMLSMITEDQDLVELGKNMLKQMGGQQTGKEELLGYECEVWEMQGAKVWIYNGITLKSEVDMMGMKMIKEPIEIKFDIDIPDEKLTVPEGIEFKVIPGMD
jgi:predicted small secreted protein